MTALQTDPTIVWVSLSELARRRGISRVSIKERADRLEAKGLLTTRREGRVRLVDLAAFDRAVGQAGHVVHEAREEAKRETSVPPQLRDAQVERAQYEARLRALDLAERLKTLVPVKQVEEAASRVAEAMLRSLEQIPSWSADLIAAAQGGQPAMVRALRDKRQKLRTAMAATLLPLAEEGAAIEAAGGAEFDIDGPEQEAP